MARQIKNTKDMAVNSGERKLPLDLTSYDLLKAIAVVIMIVDHIGMYFFPDDLWWRSIGRIGFPVWFFLVGHASGRDIPTKLWGGALLLVAGDIIVGKSLFALNALVTIIIIRLIIDPVMRISLKSQWVLWSMAALLTLLIVPSGFISEYGTMGLITAIYGYMVRHKAKINNDALIFRYMVFALLVFVIYQQISFGFDMYQFYFMAIGTMFCRLYLLGFKPETYPRLTKAMPEFLTNLIQFSGRRTLEIYVVHLLAFKFIALGLGLAGYGLFAFDVFGNAGEQIQDLPLLFVEKG